MSLSLTCGIFTNVDELIWQILLRSWTKDLVESHGDETDNTTEEGCNEYQSDSIKGEGKGIRSIA